MNRWVLSVLSCSWIRRTHNSICEKIIISSCVIHILFSWICICVIRKINIIINIVSHICRLFRLLILRSPLRSMSYVVTVFRIHNSIRVSSLVGVVNLPWLRLIHLSTITLGGWMKSSHTTGPCVCSFLFALGAANISQSNKGCSIAETIMILHSCLSTLSNALSSIGCIVIITFT